VGLLTKREGVLRFWQAKDIGLSLEFVHICSLVICGSGNQCLIHNVEVEKIKSFAKIISRYNALEWNF
jgi:hypothetical protein